eukprot:484105-Amphidinium_carterae.1
MQPKALLCNHLLHRCLGQTAKVLLETSNSYLLDAPSTLKRLANDSSLVRALRVFVHRVLEFGNYYTLCRPEAVARRDLSLPHNELSLLLVLVHVVLLEKGSCEPVT